jgi:hypothetical protein
MATGGGTNGQTGHLRPPWIFGIKSKLKNEVLGRNNHLLSLDIMRIS